MTSPLIVLGILSIVGGFVGLPAWLGTNRFFHFLEPSLALAVTKESAEASHSQELLFAALSIGVALAGIGLAYRFYILRPNAPAELAARFKGIHQVLFRKYFVDELYDAAIIDPVQKGSTEILWRKADAGLIDGIVNGTGQTIRNLASVFKHVQNGLLRGYAAWILLGMVAVILYLFSNSF